MNVICGAGLDKLDLTDAQQVKLGGFVMKTEIDTDGSSIDLSPVQSLTITGAVAVTNGAGNDDVDIGDPTLVTQIAGAVVIANGAGSNHTDLVGTDSLSVGGPITVIGGMSSDLIHLGMSSNLVSFGAITANGGGETNNIMVLGTASSILPAI